MWARTAVGVLGRPKGDVVEVVAFNHMQIPFALRIRTRIVSVRDVKRECLQPSRFQQIQQDYLYPNIDCNASKML